MELRLSREVRLGLHEHPLPRAEASNGFAGNPVLAGLTPFVSLVVTARGAADPATGMLVNIKLLDAVVREAAVEMIRAYYTVREDERPAGDLVVHLFARLAEELAGRVTLDGVELGLSPYLRLAVERKEKNVVHVTQRFEFSAAHRLHAADLSEAENQEVFGRCTNPNGHGHNYELEVTVAGEPDGHGRVVAVGELQRIVSSRVLDVFDHKHLNLDCPEFAELNPTVENIARVIYEKLTPAFGGKVRLAHVRVWETPKTWCQYPG